MTGWFISLPPFWSCLSLDTATHKAGCSQSSRTHRLYPSPRLAAESQLTTPKITGYGEPLKIWNLLSLERLGNEDTFFPPNSIFLLGKEAIGKKSTEKGCSDIRVSLCHIRISNCMVLRVTFHFGHIADSSASLMYVCSTARAKHGWCGVYSLLPNRVRRFARYTNHRSLS